MTNEQGTTGGGALRPGDRIGKYEIRDRLGVGGQSIVYKAYDELLDRFVAIKQVAPHLAVDETYLTTLKENLRKIARLGQQNEAIVTIHEVLDDPQGVFYVMEFVEGHTLETLIAESHGPVETKAALLILFRLAAALHDVHGAGIVHRDMKPGNVILTEGLRPKIIDFGVAAVAGQDASMPLATTKYLAPELYSRPDADARADLYSLGFIVYEMLLGREAFDKVFEDVVCDKHSAALRWMKWHGNEAVIAPPLHELNPAVPVALSNIITKLIEKDPDKRFADAEELGRAVKANFSPRARRAAGAPLQDAGDELLDKLSVQENLGSLESDDLEIGAPAPANAPPVPVLDDDELGGPITAPLPKESMSRTKKIAWIVVAGVVFLGFIGAGVGWLLHLREQGRMRAMSAAGMYSDATNLYEQGQYAPSLEKYELLLRRHGKTTQGKKATVLAPMCRMRLAIAQRQWGKAQKEEEKATQAAERLQERSTNKALVNWTREAIRQIEELSRSRLSTNIFWDALDQAKTLLGTARRTRDFDDVLRIFNRKLGSPGVELTADQETRVTEMQREIARRKFLFLFERSVSEADRLLARKEYAPAETAYHQAMDLFDAQPTVAQTIPPDQRNTLLGQVRQKQQDLATRRRADQTYQAILTAEKANDTTALKKALRDALQLRTLEAQERTTYQRRLQTIEANEGVSQARSLFDKADYAGARQVLAGVLKSLPTHVPAQTLQRRVEQAAKRRDAVQAGDRAFAQGKLTQALGQYRQAEQLAKDDAIRKKIRDTEYEIRLRKANALVKEGKYAEAESAYAEAKRQKPESSAHVESMLLLMRTRQKYGEYLAKGDDALQRKRWQEAIRWYNQAKQQTRDTRGVEKRISETYYQKFLTGGKAALEEENYPVARWNFKQALRYKDTPEARKLLGQASGDANKK